MEENTTAQLLKVIGILCILVGVLGGLIMFANENVAFGLISILSSLICGFVIMGLAEVIDLLNAMSQKQDNEIFFLKKLVQIQADQERENTDEQ